MKTYMPKARKELLGSNNMCAIIWYIVTCSGELLFVNMINLGGFGPLKTSFLARILVFLLL